mgnify:FL=1
MLYRSPLKSDRSEIRATQNDSTSQPYQKRVCYRLAPRVGADGARHMVYPCGDQQYQQHRGDIARSIEAQVDHVEMPAGNKNLMHLVANGAGSAKGV